MSYEEDQEGMEWIPDDEFWEDDVLAELESSRMIESREGPNGPEYKLTVKGMHTLSQYEAAVREEVNDNGGLLGAVSRFFGALEAKAYPHETCQSAQNDPVPWLSLAMRLSDTEFRAIVEDMGEAALVEKRKLDMLMELGERSDDA